MKIELLAEGGEISESDYDNKIEEAFRQLGIKLNERSSSRYQKEDMRNA